MHKKEIQSIGERMFEGNRRYSAGLPPRADISAQRRRAVAVEQHPYAAVVACSDSRVPVEHVFDLGVGDLFVVRIAGNVVGMHEAGSLEYAVKHLHVPLVLILGHTNCSAVSAALSGNGTDGAIGSIIKKVMPAVNRARAKSRGESGPEFLRAACIENIHQATADLYRFSPYIKAAADNGTVTVAGALYETETGEVVGLDA